MYSAAKYRSDLEKACKPVKKASTVFGKSLLKLDPFKTFGPCFLMVAWAMLLLFQTAFFTGRRLINR
jgi:hypothetical protein